MAFASSIYSAGGGAISHCALYMHKYKNVLYNEFNPLCEALFKGAIRGKYNEKVFTPRFITREEFFKEKDKDPYVKYICSFGNDGRTYMYSDDNEKDKKLAQDFVVSNKRSELINSLIQDTQLKSAGIHKRRMEFIRLLKNKSKAIYDDKVKMQIYHCSHLQQLQAYDRLSNLEQLARYDRLSNLERIEFHCGSYEDYQYQHGDVVYCDPPYDKTAKYSDAFDYGRFLDWCASRPYEVFFSSYDTNYDKRFYKYWQEEKRVLFNKDKSKPCVKVETLYTNKPRVQEYYVMKQMTLF